jgi:hypothetical protein
MSSVIRMSTYYKSDEYITVMKEEFFRQVLGSLIQSMEDYSTDSRGDIGSWIRQEAIKSLMDLLQHVYQQAPHYLDSMEESLTHITGHIIKQMLEKIDRVRDVALSALETLIKGPFKPSAKEELVKRVDW